MARSATRRAVLVTGGAAALIVAGAGSWALTRAPRAAREPWREAGRGFGDPRLDALSYAILAPSPHNMQPWLIELVGEDGFRVSCDLDRRLPETDPLDRQIVIGFGCLKELARMAAAEAGFRLEATPFPEGDPQPRLDARPIFEARLIPEDRVERDPLFAHALDRRTNRAPHDPDRSPDRAALDAVTAATVPGVEARASADPDSVRWLRDLTREAWGIEWSTPATRRESVDVTRIGKAEINERPWGLSLSGPLFEALNAAGVIGRQAMDTPGTTAFDQSEAFYARACDSAAAHVWSLTAGNARADQLRAGASWVRIHLAARAAGLACHPLSQALQEYPEMAGPYRRIHDRLASDGGTVQMLARLGFAGAPPPSPRQPLESRLVAA